MKRIITKERLNDRRRRLRTNNLTPADVLPHLLRHVSAYKRLNKNKTRTRRYSDSRHPPITLALADLIIILTDKILHTSKFKNYSQEWRDDMASSAHLAMCKYLHNFKENSGSCVSYLWNAIEMSMIQELARKKESEKRRLECSLDSITEMEYSQHVPEFNVNLM